MPYSVLTERERPAFEAWVAELSKIAAASGQSLPSAEAQESYFIGRYSTRAALNQDAALRAFGRQA